MGQHLESAGLKYYKKKPEEYLNSLRSGDMFILKKEPWNIKDPNAVGVYNNNEMVCHVAQTSTRYAQSLFTTDDPEEEVFVRYQEGKKMKDKEQFLLDTDNVVELEKYEIKSKSHTTRVNSEGKAEKIASPIRFDAPPYIPHEEMEIQLLAKNIARDCDFLLTRNSKDTISDSIADEIKALLEKYLTIATFSLSNEAVYCQSFIYNKVDQICRAYPDYEEKLSGLLVSLDNIIRETRNGKTQYEAYKKQLAVIAEKLNTNEFFLHYRQIFNDQDCPTKVELGEQIEAINVWLKDVLKEIYTYFADSNIDPNETDENNQKIAPEVIEECERLFAKKLCGAKFSYVELSLVYTHIIVLQLCRDMLTKWSVKGPFRRNQAIENTNRIINEYIAQLVEVKPLNQDIKNQK